MVDWGRRQDELVKWGGLAMSDDVILDETERELLLRIARRTLEEKLGRDSMDLDLGSLPEGLTLPRGCFVTLKTRANELRGCIGTFAEEIPLVSCVQEMAVNAGMSDPRLEAIGLDELDECWIEISVLTPRCLVEASDVVIGRDGLWGEGRGRRGVLLPQVATEWGWEREEFLRQVCRKAGLSPDAWSAKDVELRSFRALVFSEKTV